MRILIVEDNPVSAKLVESVLANARYSTEWASSGERALRTLTRDPAFDLIVCDMGLPGLSGLEFVAEMRNLPDGAAIPVIICTATADPRIVESAIRVGCVGYLLKPLKPAELLSRVRSLIGEPPLPEKDLDDEDTTEPEATGDESSPLVAPDPDADGENSSLAAVAPDAGGETLSADPGVATSGDAGVASTNDRTGSPNGEASGAASRGSL